MSRFAEGTDPEYIKKVNEELYGDNSSVEDTPLPASTQSAGYMGIPQIGWIAIIGVGVYYAYTKGMFKKLIK
tara:strand:+ start:2268 stop:2483 length:216 start_codon:yes stop_codon:yes gene_type:complete